jgi:hypothetical protein
VSCPDPDTGPNGYLPGTDFHYGRVKEATNNRLRKRWVEEAAAHARAVAPNSEKYGYKNIPGGGWEWSDLTDEGGKQR